MQLFYRIVFKQSRNNLSKMRALTLCVCVLVLATFSGADTIAEKLRSAILTAKEDIDSCKVEHGLSEDEKLYTKQEIRADVHTQPENEERTRKNGCCITCVLKKRHMIKDSNIDEAKIIEKINEYHPEENLSAEKMQKLQQIIHKCIEEVKDTEDECQKGLNLYVCLVKTVHHERSHAEQEAPQEEGQ